MRVTPWLPCEAPTCTLRKPSLRGPDAKTIVLSRFQLPLPKYPGASVTICGVPTAASTIFSFPRAKNARDRLSGDQNGACAPSVPDSGCALVSASGRVQSCCRPSADKATNARTRPSGDSASHGSPTGVPSVASVAPSGRAIANVNGSDRTGAGRQNRPITPTAATSTMSTRQASATSGLKCRPMPRPSPDPGLLPPSTSARASRHSRLAIVRLDPSPDTDGGCDRRVATPVAERWTRVLDRP